MTFASSHNGGLSQVNFNFIQFGYEYPFLNVVKSGSMLSAIDGTGYPDPSTLDANGYPTSIPASGSGSTGFSARCFIPPQSSRSGAYVAKWSGNSTIYLPNATSFTGSKTGSGGSGRVVWTPNTTVIDVGVSALNGSSFSNLIVCHVDDETLIDGGQVFGVKFKDRLAQAKFGVHRFLNWQSGNITNVTTWATRKPTGYIVYHGQELRSGFWCGTTTNSGDDYSVAAPPTWGGLVDKATVHLKFNASSSASNAAVTITGTVGNPLVVNWSGNTLSIGDPVGFIQASGGAFLPLPLYPGGSFYVSATGFSSGVSFQISATPGGSSLNCTVLGSGTFNAIRQPTLNLGGTGAVAIKQQYGDPVTSGSNSKPGSGKLCTLVYDAAMNCWLKFGGGAVAGDEQGLQSGAPPEICIQLAAEMGAHPYFVTPFLASDPLTDYMTSLAAYCRDNGPTWMIPRFEGINECWNNGFYGTRYAWNKSAILWGSTLNQDDFNGKVISVLGQAISAVYSTNRTKYEVLCGVQTATGASPSAARLTAPLYVAQAAAAQSPYLKDPAYKWATAGCCAQYMAPSYYGDNREMVLAYAYSVTHAGNAALQATDAATYVDTLADTNTNNVYNTLSKLSTLYQQWAAFFVGTAQSGGAWGSGQYRLKLFGYEGGYSPDYNSGNVFSNVTGATQANPCVLTLPTTNFQGIHSANTGNPAVAGMTVTMASVGGMTQLNGNTYTITKVGVADGLAANEIAINVDATAFSAYTSGGTATYVNSGTWMNPLRKAGKNAPKLLYHLRSNYDNFIAAGGAFPSLFQMGGGVISSNSSSDTGGDWSVLDPDIWVSDPPQWTSIALFNAGKRRLTAST